jgi:hypothetical protein
MTAENRSREASLEKKRADVNKPLSVRLECVINCVLLGTHPSYGMDELSDKSIQLSDKSKQSGAAPNDEYSTSDLHLVHRMSEVHFGSKIDDI